MADSDYHIPWSADLTPALALLGQSRRAKRQEAFAAEQARLQHEQEKIQNVRSDQHLQFQRESHRENMERQSHELKRLQDLDKRKQEIENFNARDALFRTAQRSPEAASQNPFGYSFEAHNDLPANVEGPELSPAAEAARFQLAGGPASKAGAPAPVQAAPIPEPEYPDSVFTQDSGGPQLPPRSPSPGGLVPIEMEPSQTAPGLAGLDEDAAMRNVSAAMNRQVNEPTGGNMDVEGQRPAPLAQPDPTATTPETAQAAQHMLGMQPGPEGKRRVFASYQGKQFELPEQATTSGFGAKYDAIYQRFLQEPGVTPEEALRAVTKMAHEDSVESGRDKRAEAAEDARSQRDAQYRMDIAGQFEQQRRALAQSDKNSQRAASAQRARVGDPETKQDKMDLGIERETDAIVKEVLNQTSYKGRVTDDQKFNQMSTVIAGAKGNAALAAAGAGMWVKQAQGGTGVISDSDMNQFWGKIGGVQDKVENYVANALSGKMGAGKQKIVADAIKTLAGQSKRNLQEVGKRIESRLYPIGEKVPQVDDRIQTYLDTYVPGAQRTSAPRRAGGTGKTALDDLESQLDALGGSGGR